MLVELNARVTIFSEARRRFATELTIGALAVIATFELIRRNTTPTTTRFTVTMHA